MKLLVRRLAVLQGNLGQVLQEAKNNPEFKTVDLQVRTEPLTIESGALKEIQRHADDDLVDLILALRFEVTGKMRDSDPGQARRANELIDEFGARIRYPDGFEWTELEQALERITVLLRSLMTVSRNYQEDLKLIHLSVKARLEHKYDLLNLPTFW